MKLVLKKTKLRSFFKKLALLAVIVLPVSINAQNFKWAKRIGGNGNESGYAITTDGAGNIYTAGHFERTVDFNPGAGTFSLTTTVSPEIFISKLDASGNFVWAKQMGGTTSSDYAHSIAIDGTGNVYTAGYFNGTADFDPGAGTFSLTSAGNWDVFISKLDASGNFVWAKQLGGTNNDLGFSMAIDGVGNIYSSGTFSGTADFDPGAGTYTLTSAGNNDIFISKLDASGNFVWAKQMGGTSVDYAYAIDIDGVGNIYSTGTFSGTADFDPGAGTFTLTSAGNEDIFISKLDASGNFVWAKKIGGTNSDVGQSIVLDGAGDVYTTGRFPGTVDFNPGTGTFTLTSAGSTDIFISKLDALGNFVWAKKLGGIGYDNATSIALDGAGNIYTTGNFAGTANFDPGAGTFNLTSAGSTADIFISKLDVSGNFVWAKKIGGTSFDQGRSITVDGTRNVYTTGYFQGTANFDTGTGTFNLTATADDIFIHKLSQCNTNFGTDVISACGSHTWINGITYTVSNSTATKTLTNVAGCDSIVTLNLTIKNSNTGTDVISACNSHTWIDGITYTVSNSTATKTLTNVAGCDSIVTLNLTIKNSNTGTDVISACNSHTWIDGITYTVSNNTATKTLTNVAGCDSIVTLNLTIKNSNTGTDVISACNSHTWIDGITYTASNSTATKTLTNVAGCDSIVTLNLTIKNSNTGTDVISACNSHTWIDGITYTVSNSTATKTLTNVAGCDSIVTLNLTINSSPSLTFAISADIVCATDGTLALTATPSGGTFSGQGVTGNMFDPAAVTSSSYVFITYSYTDGNTCSNTAMDSIYVSGCVGLKNYSMNPEVKIYPNPTEDNITIDLGATESSVKLVVKNELGQLVFQTTYSTTSVINFNLQEKAGIYFIEITTDSGNTGHFKLIKH